MNGGEAQAIRRRLVAGEPFETLVKQSIDDQTRNLSGALGWVQREVPVRGLGQNPAFIESVLAVPQGGVSRPLRTNLGYHVVKVETHEDAARPGPGIRPKPSLERKIYSQKFETAFRRTIDSLETKYTVRVDEKALLGEEGYVEQEARRLFEQAQGTSDGPDQALRADCRKARGEQIRGAGTVHDRFRICRRTQG